MLYVIVNCFLYFIVFLFYRRKYKSLDLFLFIIILYAVTALLCALHYLFVTPTSWPDLQLIPFLYLFTVLLILFVPLYNFELVDKDLLLVDNWQLRLLSCLYISCALYDIVTSISLTIQLFQSGEWGELREQFYADENSIQLYANQYQRFAKNICSYLSPFAVVYAFIQLAKQNVPVVLTVLLFVSIIVPSVMAATVIASRGMVVNIAMTLTISYLLFRHIIPETRKQYIYYCAAGVLAFFLVYTISVSISRFGDEAGDSVFAYFGHSMLYFNDGIFNNLHEYAWGKRFFSWFIDLYGGNSEFNLVKAGATHGTAFYTIVGSLFLDWGPIGTIIVAIIAGSLMFRLFHKDQILLSDTVLIVFYTSTLSKGIFAFGTGRALIWIMTFVVYYIIKQMEKNNSSSHNIIEEQYSTWLVS